MLVQNDHVNNLIEKFSEESMPFDNGQIKIVDDVLDCTKRPIADAKTTILV